MQVFLQIEAYCLVNADSSSATPAKVRVDEDGVWEIGNSIRALNQTFRDKFKIEKFLFGEIYPSYGQAAPEFVASLMEELGYDKDEHSPSSESDSECEQQEAAARQRRRNSLSSATKRSPSLSAAVQGSNLSSSNGLALLQKSPSSSGGVLLSLDWEGEDAADNSYCCFTAAAATPRLTSLFEDFEPRTELAGAAADSNDVGNESLAGPGPSQTNGNNADSDDLLDEFKKKKT